MYFIFRRTGGAAGAIGARVDDILGCGEPDVLPKVRRFSAPRFGGLYVQEKSFAHVGAGLPQATDFSAQSAQKGFAGGLNVTPTSPELWAARRRLPATEEIKICQCNLGVLRGLATVLRPDISARHARIAPRANPQQEGGNYHINDSPKPLGNGDGLQF